jgi:hypothetical protein
MKEQLGVGRRSFSIKLTFALALSFTIAIAVPFTAAFAQTPESAIPEKAPINRDQQVWTYQRNACIALGKETLKYRATTADQRAKLPKMSKLQAREGYEQWEDCARMVPHHDLSHTINPSKSAAGLPRGPVETPTPQL